MVVIHLSVIWERFYCKFCVCTIFSLNSSDFKLSFTSTLQKDTVRDGIKSFNEIQKNYINWLSLVNWLGDLVIEGNKFTLLNDLKSSTLWYRVCENTEDLCQTVTFEVVDVIYWKIFSGPYFSFKIVHRRHNIFVFSPGNEI